MSKKNNSTKATAENNNDNTQATENNATKKFTLSVKTSKTGISMKLHNKFLDMDYNELIENGISIDTIVSSAKKSWAISIQARARALYNEQHMSEPEIQTALEAWTPGEKATPAGIKSLKNSSIEELEAEIARRKAAQASQK